MSTRRLNVEITGNSRGLEAALNRIDQGLGRTQSRVRGVNKEMNLWERQIMAIGTTARYALAGQFVFGITAAIARLGDFTNKLGQVAALAGKVTAGQYKAPSDSFLKGVGDAAILESNKVGVAVGDIQTYMQRFFSTFDKVPQGQKMKQMTLFVDEVARLAAMLGSEAGDPQQLAGGIASMVNQMNGGKTNPGRVSNRVANLISESIAQTPTITGRDIGRDIGRMGQAMTAGGFTPEQLFAIWTQAGKGGGSAATIARGLSQLLGTSLLRPQTPEQMRAYAQVGLPSDPNMLAQRGGLSVLEQIMNRVSLKPRNIKALTDENVSDEDALALSGVSKYDRTLLYNLFGRQESVRQFITLMAQGGVPALEKMIASMKKAEEVNTVRQREEAFQKQNTLTRFANARTNLNLGLARATQPFLENVIAPPVMGLSNQVTKHQEATQVALAALFGGAALAKGRSLYKAFRGRGGSPGTELVSGLLATEAMPNVLAGGPTDGSRANPYWVIIHPDSWFVGTPKGSGGPLGGGPGDTGIPPVIATGLPDKAPKGGAFRKLLGRVPVAGAVALGAYEIGNMFTGGQYSGKKGYGEVWRDLGDLFSDDFGPPKMNDKLNKQLEDAKAAKWKNPFGTAASQVNFFGKGQADVTVKLVDAQGRPLITVPKVGVPMTFENAKQAPTYKGKNKANKTNPSQVP